MSDTKDLISRWIGSMTASEVNMVEDAIAFWRKRGGVTKEEIDIKVMYDLKIIGYYTPDGPCCLEDAEDLRYSWAIYASDESAEEMVCWLCGEHLVDEAEDGE